MQFNIDARVIVDRPADPAAEPYLLSHSGDKAQYSHLTGPGRVVSYRADPSDRRQKLQVLLDRGGIVTAWAEDCRAEKGDGQGSAG